MTLTFERDLDRVTMN